MKLWLGNDEETAESFRVKIKGRAQTVDVIVSYPIRTMVWMKPLTGRLE